MMMSSVFVNFSNPLGEDQFTYLATKPMIQLTTCSWMLRYIHFVPEPFGPS